MNIKRRLVGQILNENNCKVWKFRISSIMELMVTERKDGTYHVAHNMITNIRSRKAFIRRNVKNAVFSSVEAVSNHINKLNILEDRRLNNRRIMTCGKD